MNCEKRTTTWMMATESCRMKKKDNPKRLQDSLYIMVLKYKIPEIERSFTDCYGLKRKVTRRRPVAAEECDVDSVAMKILCIMIVLVQVSGYDIVLHSFVSYYHWVN